VLPPHINSILGVIKVSSFNLSVGFRCNLRYEPGHVLADVLFIHPLASSYIRSAARTPSHAAALRDADKHRDNFADQNCPG
jgi:hypothetical protein